MKNLYVSGSQIAAPAHTIVFKDQMYEQSGYVMTSLPVLQNQFRFLIFYFLHLLNQTPFSCIGQLLAKLNIL